MNKVPSTTSRSELCCIDKSRLLALANTTFGQPVDCDMRGKPITDCDVLLYGAYGNAVMRLVNLAVNLHAGIPTSPGEIFVMDEPRLRVLAREAFGQSPDYDFGGNLIVKYDIVLEFNYGYGQQALNLVNLALRHHSDLQTPATTQ